MFKNEKNSMNASKIIGVQFSILSPDEIRNSSVAEITSRDTYINNKPVLGGLFDPRMGVLEPGLLCPTDGLNYIDTPGYFGHIELARPVYYIQFLNTIMKILRCTCIKCGKLLVNKEKHENMLNQLAKVAIPLIQQMYTEEKVIRLVQPNGAESEERINFYKEMDEGVVKKFHDIGTGKYDVKVVSGSTLPTNRMALLNTYMQMHQAGLIDQVEVLKKSELVDVEGVLERAGQMQQMAQEMEMLQQELKKVKGDLQTATREEVHAKKRLEVEKFSGDLDKISNRADMAASLYKARLGDAKSNLINSVSPEELEALEEDNLYDVTAKEMES